MINKTMSQSLRGILSMWWNQGSLRSDWRSEIYMDGLTDVSFISRLKIIYLMHSNSAVSMTKVKITVFTILRRKAPKSKIFKKAFRFLITPDVWRIENVGKISIIMIQKITSILFICSSPYSQFSHFFKTDDTPSWKR